MRNVARDMLLFQAEQVEQLLPAVMRRLRRLDPSHRSNQLPLAQLRLCSLLFQSPATISALSRELGTSVSGVTQLADRLEAAGLVERVVEPHDRRTRSLRLTPEGQSLMQSRRENLIDCAVRALERLSPDERARVVQGLAELLQAAEGATATPLVAP